jgi:hypothetical protein
MPGELIRAPGENYKHMKYREQAYRTVEAGFMTASMLVILSFLFVVGVSLMSYVLSTKTVEKKSSRRNHVRSGRGGRNL